MIPKRIVLENFLSFGSPATAIVFGDDEPLWVLGGPNGVGKSAVFDAMTYALFTEHRGGASDHASLIRHGTNGFRLVFEFEFNAADYRITRTRSTNGRPTQRVEQRRDGGWVALELPAASGRQDAVKLWSERTLGLGFDAFTASVLLRQGQADEIITATGGRRLEILKKIIGVERYEALSDRIHAAARRRRPRQCVTCCRHNWASSPRRSAVRWTLPRWQSSSPVLFHSSAITPTRSATSPSTWAPSGECPRNNLTRGLPTPSCRAW
jgi:exonuclease SbcC